MKPMEISDQNFEQEVLLSDIPVLIDFWATWCAPCRLIAPHVEAIANEYQGKVKVCKLDIDNSQQTAIQYGVRSIPTLILFDKGKVVDRIVGVVPKQKILDMLSAVVTP
ncbi:MAG: thioredoxin [Bacteroidota bacterium]|nr:thioredoxin [Bacteroidota bacterium]